jgi:hypothetical protein
MKRDADRFLAPLIAVALFAFVVVQTLHALHDSGVWRFGVRKAYVPPADPLAELDGLIASAQRPTFAGAARDPFGYGAVTTVPDPLKPLVHKPVVPPPPEVPVLTAIVFDADPRAQLRWKGHEYTVHEGGLFAEFVVGSITRDQVVLKRRDETIILQRKPQGE